MKSLQNNNIRSTVLFTVLLLVAGAASAGGGGGGGGVGGMTTATTTATAITTAFFGFVGACAGGYLLYVGIMAKADKKTWGDFGMAVVHVALVGASLVLATWAWKLFH